MQTMRPVQIDVRNAITSLALLLVAAALQDRRPGEAVKVLCDDSTLAGDLARVFRDWTCEDVQSGGGSAEDCYVITMCRNPTT